MTREQAYIAHLLFKNKVLESDGNTFEAFFTTVMSMANPNFQQVKPQGCYGDRKNDGFDQTTGTYYQVYSPENPELKEKDAIDKLVKDFNGLYNYWQSICPIKHFYYVTNDKFKGAYATVHEELARIHKEHPNVVTNTFLAKDLWPIIMGLSDNQVDACLGYIPETYSGDVDYSILQEVVTYLLGFKRDPSRELIPSDPDFNKKILFNGLSDVAAGYLKSYRKNEYSVTDFFRLNSTFAKDALRNIFSGLYHEAEHVIEDSKEKPDQVFFYIYEHSYSDHNIAVDAAIFTLMAYYFEYCDIFKTPEV